MKYVVDKVFTTACVIGGCERTSTETFAKRVDDLAEARGVFDAECEILRIDCDVWGKPGRGDVYDVRVASVRLRRVNDDGTGATVDALHLA